jgi:large subunit ribosomal protein L10
MDGKALATRDIAALANLPSKEEIYSKLLYMLQAPATRLASALAGVGRNLAVVVNQGVKENKFKGGEEASA